MKLHRLFLIIATVFMIGYTGQAQQVVFGTAHAVMNVNINYADSVIKLQTSDLKVSLNYQTAECFMHLKGKDLYLLDSTWKADLSELEELEFTFTGNFDLDYIKTTNHPPFSFEVQGDLRFGVDDLQLMGKGDLTQISDGAYPSQISLEFKIGPDDLQNLSMKPEGFEYIIIEIEQTALEDQYDR